jgi:hypothetical protein
VVLLKINVEGVSILEFESDAPRSVDMNCVPLWVETLKGVKVKARKLQFADRRCLFETIQPQGNARVHFLINFGCRPVIEKLLQAFIPECLNQIPIS